MVGDDAADFADAPPVLGAVESTVVEACGVDAGGLDHTALLGESRTALRPERVNLGLERSQRD